MRQSIPGRWARRLASLGLCFVLTMTAIPFAGAITQEEINALEQQQSDLQGQMSSIQSQIDDLQDQQDTAVQQSLLYQQQLGVLAEQVNNTQTVIADYETQIAQTQEELAAAQAEAEQYYQLFCERFRDMEESGNISYWSILFDSASFSDLLDRLNFIREVATYDNSVVDALEAARQQVADTEARLEEEKAGQEAALAELESQQAAIQDASDKNDALLAEIQANQSTYASQLAALEAENEELAQDIITSKAEYEAQQAELQRQAEEAERRRQEEEAAAADDSSDSGSSSDAGSSSSGSGGSSSSGSGNVSSGNGSAVVDYAMQFLGNPYVWGGTSLTNGCDCSGFVMQVYAQFGYSLPHSSSAQRNYGQSVSLEDIQPGDIVCYNHHVGIYVGDGTIISALGEKYGITYSDVNYKSIITIRRIFG